MSVRLMSAIWDMEFSPVEKLVLLALADWANDDGVAWPSIAQLARKTGCGERTVQRTLRDAEKAGLLARHEVRGKGNSYRITPATLAPHPRHAGTPAPKSPVPETTDTPATLAPNTPVNTITPTKTSSSPERRASKSRFRLPDDIPADEWRDFEEMRKTIRKPMTDSIRAKAVERLRKLQADGWPPGEVLSHSTLNNYQGLFPPKDHYDGNRTARSMDGKPDLRGARPDPALSLTRAARAAEAEEAPGPAGGWEDYRGAWPALSSSRLS